ncbi:transglycosylase family protein [Streptomyces sp. NBC_00078]|uniref:LysM peptidoglycan-binding domain-containing protein n=1 Tax=unclassified Streptomyces TaxID=2593676 RepID=UPI00225C08E0|nr:transglycosylase family protein [Streptomyces sp. NBC_00078]MCX5421340.1 LysM peptidoglycan-binding domain-containing protein [Streptomyces sp. NBC_00078]
MLSGNGRHRRPRQAPALLVAAGVTGSAIAIPLLGAASAHAADGTTWDKVAKCETGGAWSENNGNGFYGGLKLTQQNWEKYGGLDYAPSADLASRNQQIAVAEKLLDDQGVGAFHLCGLTSGLNKDSDSADIDTGILDGGSGSSDSSGASDSTGLSNSSGNGSSGSSSSDSSSGASSSTSPSASEDAKGDSAESGTSASPSASPSKTASREAQRSDASSADRAKGGDSDNVQQEVGSWSLVDTGALGTGRHRGASAEGTKADTRTDDTYTVHAGDTLASIADSLGLDGGWHALYAENEKALGSDPNRIVAGQTLRLPAE